MTPDPDAEIIAMVDDFLAKTAPKRRGQPAGAPRSAAQRAHDIRRFRQKFKVAQTEIPSMREDFEFSTDETPVDDVRHAGVIGTEP